MSYSIVNQKAEKLAASIVFSIGVPEPSLKDILTWFEEDMGITFSISEVDLSRLPVCGLVYYDSVSSSYTIKVDKNDSIERQRYSVYHEFGHVLRDKELVYGFFDGDVLNKDEEERFSNRFAAALLMPEVSFSSKWNSIKGNFHLKKFMMAEYYGVSKETVLYRVKELGLNTENN